MTRRWVIVMTCTLSAWGSARAGDGKAAASEHVRGDVTAVQADTVTVKTPAGGSVAVALPKEVPVAQVEKAGLDAIRDGTFVGMITVPERNGSLRAVEVHVFPESMRGTGEGSQPWDLRPGSNMTNATVASTSSGPGGSGTMTNATVGNVGAAGTGRTVELKAGGESKKVVVPPGAAVVKLEPADRSALKPGAHVFAIATRRRDGSLSAERIFVGEGNVRPPM